MGNKGSFVMTQGENSGVNFRKADTLFYSPKGGLASKQKATTRHPNGSFEIINTDTKGIPMNLFFDQYDLAADVLGSGSYGEVKLAKDKETDELVAVKILSKRSMDPGDLEDVRREVEIMKSLSHENIVKVYGYYENSNFVYVVMEYMEGGELYTKVDKLRDYTEKDTRDILLTLIVALKHCKDRGIAHRDIKPENILLRKQIRSPKVSEAPNGKLKESFKEAKRKYEIALADFGFAIQSNKSAEVAALETQCGSPLFIAPEIVKEVKYNYKCDVWSLGVVGFMLLSGGYYPFMADSIEELKVKLKTGKWDFEPDEAWDKVSNLGKDFISRMIVADPKKRATYEELLAHKWFKDTSINTPEADKSVNFAAMKKFNMKRKMLKAIKARQAAAIFKTIMMEDDGEDIALTKYKEVSDLGIFFRNPDLKTQAEKKKKNDSDAKDTDEGKEDPPKQLLASYRDPRLFKSTDFTDLDV